MLVLFFFSFLAGIFTVLSPCILPILPAILSAGTTEGKLRPLGIILGLILSFSFFTLTLSAIVQATGLSPNVLRYTAIILIFLFGLIMLFPKLSDIFAKLTVRVATVGQKIQAAQSKKGFWSGIVFGIALGLLWTPCAGPILGAITTLVATHAISAMTVFLTLAYSLGAGLPLLLITYGSGKIIQSSQFLSKHSEGIRRFFGLIMILLAIVLAFHWEMLLEQKLLRYFPKGLVESNPRLDKELRKLQGKTGIQGKAPELVGIKQWINTSPLSLEELKGHVVLIDFWTYSCINCLRTLPYLEKWYSTYQDKGLVVIGVHTPEFEFEKNYQNVAEAAESLGITYPIALDNDYQTWQAYENNYWPAHYLIDQEGNIRMVHFGEGGYVETENDIRSLLGLDPLAMQEPQGKTRPITPEIYLGMTRERNYTPEITLKFHQVVRYNYTEPLKKDHVGIKGPWIVEREYIMAEGEGSILELNFQAKQVYLVLSGSSPLPLQVYLDDKPYKKIIVDKDQKYDIINTTYGRHSLRLVVPSGIKAYTFTFGDE